MAEIKKPYERRPRVQQEALHKINRYITAQEVRLIVEGAEPRIAQLRDALRIAEEMDLDLVEISPKAVPPVCKVVDYKKFLYDQKKKQKEIKSKQSKVIVKEIRFGPNTDEHDVAFKLKHAIKFLGEGSKIKAFVFFKGRSIVFKERGEIILLQFAQDLQEHGVIEQLPKLDGKKMIMLINPKKKK